MRGDPGSDHSSSSSTTTRQGERLNNLPPRRPIAPDPSSDSSSDGTTSDSSSLSDDSSFGSDFFEEEPSTVFTNDLDQTKARKREKKRRYRAKLNKMKYQQSFLKEDPPFTYRGEIQVGLFKKWCRELRDWAKRARLNRKKSIRLAGKYLDGRAYRFYERDVLDLKKRYTLTTFFKGLFDYVFPADFRMQQRDKFDACRQDGRSVLDFLRKLQEIADTVGDIGDRDVVLAFWRRCQPYLRAELTKNGYDATTISIITLESECVRYEKAKRVIDEDRHRRPQSSRECSNPHKQSTDQLSTAATRSTTTGTHTMAQNPKQASQKPQHDNGKVADKERKQHLRKEGKCFNCEGTDHIERNCPKRWQTKDKRGNQRLLLNSVGMSAAEARLAAIEEGTELGLFALCTAASPDEEEDSSHPIEVHAIERSAARVKGLTRLLPKPTVIVVRINDKPCRALLDSGSLSDFASTTLVDQLQLPLDILDKPLNLQLAVSGSRSKVKATTSPQLSYQHICERRTLDVANLDSYDLILGMPFLFQHKILLGFNPSQVTVQSNASLPIQGTQTIVLESRAAEIQADRRDRL